MIRCYLVGDRVAGFGHQFVTPLTSPMGGDSAPPSAPPRLYYGPAKPEFQALKQRMESEWVPEMLRRVDLDPALLPVIWDADFLLGPKDAAGDDTYVLCEINVSSVYPMPAEAYTPLAEAADARVGAASRARAS